MNKKYYDIIVSLIKEHRKYTGCESILDDIAEDVYSHSKVVIDSISNEEVLISYFKKVISTSIVTIPKKLNVKTRVSSTIVLPPITEPQARQTEISDLSFGNDLINTATLEEEDNDDESMLEKPNNDTVYSSEEVLYEDNKVLDESSEELFVQTEAQEQEQEQTSFDLPEDSENFEEELLETPEENSIIEIEATEFMAEKEDNDNSYIDNPVDKTLVDKMINGITEDISDQGNNTEELEIETELLETLDIEDTEVAPENSSIEESFLLSTEDEIFPAEENEILSIEQEEASTDVHEITLEEDVDSLIDLSEKEELIDETSSLNSMPEETLEETESSPEPIGSSETSMPPSFECFDYSPEFPNYEIDDILAELESIEEKYPEKQILEICNLKYNMKMSVQEIAKKLDMNTEDVIYVLGEIIETVKD